VRALASAGEDAPAFALTLPPVWVHRLEERGEGAARPDGPDERTVGRERGPFADWLDRALDDDHRPEDDRRA
jgi:hypothetical protein